VYQKKMLTHDEVYKTAVAISVLQQCRKNTRLGAWAVLLDSEWIGMQQSAATNKRRTSWKSKIKIRMLSAPLSVVSVTVTV
jgi:hypothetical protein